MIKSYAIQTAATAAVAVLAVGMVHQYAIKHAVVDLPNARSSHRTPTPRGGGLGLLAAFVLVGIGSSLPLPQSVTLAMIGVLPTAIIGWADDRSSLPVRLRLTVHILTGLSIMPLGWLAHDSMPPVIRIALGIWWAFFAVSSINVVNFVDGIDGLVAAQVVVFAIHCLAIVPDSELSARLAGSLGGAALGFLVWNWSPAKIFLGDVGSGTIGALMLIVALFVSHASGQSPIQVLLPLYPIFLDATATLSIRALRGAMLQDAHRDHLYQRLANGGWGHARTSALYAALAALAIPTSRSINGLVVYFTIVPTFMWLLSRTSAAAKGRQSKL